MIRCDASLCMHASAINARLYFKSTGVELRLGVVPGPTFEVSLVTREILESYSIGILHIGVSYCRQFPILPASSQDLTWISRRYRMARAAGGRRMDRTGQRTTPHEGEETEEDRR